MKMMYRLHLSFALLLLCILAITAVLIYPLLLDNLVDNQRKELRAQASLLMNLSPVMPLLDDAQKQVPGSPAQSPVQASDTQWLATDSQRQVQPTGTPSFIHASRATADTNAVLIAPGGDVVYSTLPGEATSQLMELSNLDIPGSKGFWQGTDDQYIVETLTTTQGIESSVQAVKAVMATPLSKIKEMQLALFKRLLLILSVGGIVAFLLSMVITRRLVKPLGDLRKELNKVEMRRFSEVRLIETGGEIGVVAKAVYDLAGELEKYQHTQKQFFQNASHELKTPLMSIQGYAEGIKDGIFTGDHANKGLNAIVKECERLKKIVTEMVLLSKLESEEGIFHMDRVPVRELIAETLERINPLLVKNGLQVEITGPDNGQELLIYADREKLLQALINILGNAARYAKETIRIQTSADAKGIDIGISDDGEGIPEPLLSQLFQRFAKGKNGETGLGLAISRAIVERCRGRISAHNEPGGGAAFVLRFPILF
ncbi:HAMP domain-containing histidine kinase [Paenibacillus hemerocallicola]|uniref:histidine kinase n=1 Tax=Paenibacillus hemerocallicola TaxID=1172614 RepID=A0A5C4T3G2_9BACL|nr:HAMP domain-containing sensor histidine kinase [Paenibacillus hemerocallicola]TNJ63290.1 HAMP domain-containing histidine kinase [Paenibacillus hemerocallicola]